MIDAVLSYHRNPDTCGVTRFNVQLAQKLGVPHQAWPWTLTDVSHPLLSLKGHEFSIADRRVLATVVHNRHFDVLWHDEGDAAVSAIADRVLSAVDLGCPSTLQGQSDRKGITILTFGMAHKFHAEYFAQLKRLLDARYQDYTICVSAAVHEGSPWDDITEQHRLKLERLFGEHLRWLGFLADDGLAKEIRDAHLIALFYLPAVRANNTTLWAALERGTPVITNLDKESPEGLAHNINCFDIHQLTEWPEANLLREVRAGGTEIVKRYSWDAFLEKLQAVHA